MKKDKKTKHLEFEFQANNSKRLKSWTKEISSSKLKDAGSVRIASRSSDDKKLDAFFDNLIRIEELADYIGVSQKTIRNWVAMRSIPFLRIGRKTFFRYEKISGWLQTKEFEPCL
ncbi:MAG: helix-turn-helix domain-containing protein [Oligoflexia bacterium]|nr:helix-turn-helix domain-containing protein [Oligoflexia bacterium]